MPRLKTQKAFDNFFMLFGKNIVAEIKNGSGSSKLPTIRLFLTYWETFWTVEDGESV